MNAREGRDFQRVYTERVRRKLLQLAQDWGPVTGDGVKLHLPPTHALLGEMVGCLSEHCRHILKHLSSFSPSLRTGCFEAGAVS
jgi:hypothetical protein